MAKHTAKSREESGWVRCSDTPPEYGKVVLLYVIQPSWSGEVIEGFRNLNRFDKDFYRIATGQTLDASYILYWHEMPEEPPFHESDAGRLDPGRQ